MSPQLLRLKRRPEFLRVAGTGKKWVAPGLILQVRRHAAGEVFPTDGVLRVGFTVSKKVGNSVERNRAKRRLRALASEILAAHAKAGADVVIIGRRATLKRSFAKLRQDLTMALERMDLFRQEDAVPS